MGLTMKKTLCFVFTATLLASALSLPTLSQIRGGRRPEAEARNRAEARQQRRDDIQEELKAATNSLETLTKVLVGEVAESDGYTTSMQILEASGRIEELAKLIEELAKTINRRARGR
jgi:peptidoglycan hydrolase CwlO-like protein